MQSPWNSPPQSPRIIMAGNVNANQHVNPNANYPPPVPSWRTRTPVDLSPPLHDLSLNPENSLPKFKTGECIPVDDHLQGFSSALEGLVVDHEDIVCILFPHSLKGKSASWYFG